MREVLVNENFDPLKSLVAYTFSHFEAKKS